MQVKVIVKQWSYLDQLENQANEFVAKVDKQGGTVDSINFFANDGSVAVGITWSKPDSTADEQEIVVSDKPKSRSKKK